MHEGEKQKFKLDVAVEFLEVAFHSILYFRNVYPKVIFCLRKKYQIPVHVSRHPEVNSYVNECLKTIKKLLEEDGVKRVALIIIGEDEEPLEKYCFDFEEPDRMERDYYFVKTEEVFRDYLLKLSVADFERENKFEGGQSFRVEIVTKENCSVRLNDNPDQDHFPWIESESGEDMMTDFRIFPIKTLNTFDMKLNMYVEKWRMHEQGYHLI